MASRFATRAACVQPRLANPPACGRRESGAYLKVWVTGGIVLLTLAAYMPVCRAGFVNLDDPDYVTLNSHVRTGLSSANLAWSFSTFHAANWHPLTWISLQADAQLYGLEPAGFHVTNVILHAGSAVLLFWSLSRMTGLAWPGALVAALFAAHPLHVESVAWIAERKDVLSGFFWMLTLWVYARYAEHPSTGRYACVALAFTLGLLAKPMLVTLPFVLLLLDYWPLRRIGHSADASLGRRLSEKVPLLVLAGASCVVTVIAQSHAGTVRALDELPLTARLAHAALALIAYLGDALWPSGLAVFYPYTRLATFDVRVAGALLLLASISVLVYREQHRQPYLVVGWLWYVGTLIPVVGIVQVGAQAMADRYTYIPLVGPSVMLAWGGRELIRHRALRRGILGAAVIGLGACAALTFRQAGYWRDSLTLWEHTIRVTPTNARAQASLANALADCGRLEEAAGHYQKALAINARYVEVHAELGAVLLQLGFFDGAIRELDAAVQLLPRNSASRYNLALALMKQSDWNGARSQLDAALRQNPRLAEAHCLLGYITSCQGDYLASVGSYDLALHVQPRFAQAHHGRGVALGRLGRWAEAHKSFSAAVELDPSNQLFRRALAEARRQLGVEKPFHETQPTPH